MAKFQFIAVDADANSSTAKEFSAESIHRVLEEFQYFLKGAGYEFDGTIELAPLQPESGMIDIDLNGFYPDPDLRCDAWVSDQAPPEIHYGYPTDIITNTGETHGKTDTN